MHANSGYPGEAESLARRFVEIFAPYDAVVTPSGSCAAQVREHMPGLLGGDDRGVPARTWELSQFLTGVLGVEDVGSTYEGSVAYHPTCHSLRLLRVGDCAASAASRRARGRARRPPRRRGVLRLRRDVRGQERRRLERDARREAGGDRRLGRRHGICACDSSCLMHIGGGLRRRGSMSGRCTWRRSSRRERCALATRGRRASRRRRPLLSPTRGCARTSVMPRARSAASGLRSWRRCPTGRRPARAAAAAIKDETLARPRRGARRAGDRPCRRPAARCTGRATRRRRTRS